MSANKSSHTIKSIKVNIFRFNHHLGRAENKKRGQVLGGFVSRITVDVGPSLILPPPGRAVRPRRNRCALGLRCGRREALTSRWPCRAVLLPERALSRLFDEPAPRHGKVLTGDS